MLAHRLIPKTSVSLGHPETQKLLLSDFKKACVFKRHHVGTLYRKYNRGNTIVPLLM